MSSNSKIEWTEATWNPVTGCDKVSPGCKNCYAETFAERFRGVKGHPYEQGFDLKLWPERLDIPLDWKKSRRVFVNSMSDLFHSDVPVSFIDEVFATMAVAEQHIFQVLTKRPERMYEYMQRAFSLEPSVRCVELFRASNDRIGSSHNEGYRWPLPNVWLGISCEDQQRANERVPFLLQTPAAVHFISCEPLLGPIDLRFPKEPNPNRNDTWVIVGGESGPGARECRIGWIRDIIRQCREANIPVFVKQLGARPYWIEGEKRFALKLKDRKGGDMSEWPDDELKVREYPKMEEKQ